MPVAGKQLIWLHPKPSTINRNVQVEVGRLTIDVTDDGMDAVPVFLIVSIGEGRVSAEVTVTMNVGD